MFGLIATLALFTLHFQTGRAACECGYIDSQGHVWREALVANFTQSAGALAALQKDWQISNWDIPQEGNKVIRYTPNNVFQHNDALGIKVSAYSGSGPVNSGEITTLRSDIKYGTFRMRAVVPTVPGVVFGFFTYISETQEQDIEFLSSDPNYYQTVHYTNQPGLIDGDVDPAATRDVVVPGADFTYVTCFSQRTPPNIHPVLMANIVLTGCPPQASITIIELRQRYEDFTLRDSQLLTLVGIEYHQECSNNFFEYYPKRLE
ncbi:hypothetical protein FRC15_004770 [Serendipita sp. 397]|nr:hypothetical protein FRC15_004770 [Serendipita sp. 397]